MSNKITQEGKIVNFCKANVWITQRDALMLGIYRLASRISDMTTKGYWIARELISVDNADGSKSRVARYRIIRTPEGELFNG